MKYDDFKEKVGTWGEYLRPFIESQECEDIYSFLRQRRAEGKKILPSSQVVFKAFKECPFNDLKVVIIGYDPYPQMIKNVPVADGIAFSSSATTKVPDSLRSFFEAVISDTMPSLSKALYEHTIEINKDLTYLANQGVLLLNYSLTTEWNRVGIHSDKKLWEPFHRFLIEEIINVHKNNVVYILLGEYAKSLEKYIIPFNSYVIKLSHPSFAARNGIAWDCKGAFSITNKLLKEYGKDEIVWFKEENYLF